MPPLTRPCRLATWCMPWSTGCETVLDELDCASYLEKVHDMADQPTGSVLQLQAFRETGNLAEVVRRMVAWAETQPHDDDMPALLIHSFLHNLDTAQTSQPV